MRAKLQTAAKWKGIQSLIQFKSQACCSFKAGPKAIAKVCYKPIKNMQNLKWKLDKI